MLQHTKRTLMKKQQHCNKVKTMSKQKRLLRELDSCILYVVGVDDVVDCWHCCCCYLDSWRNLWKKCTVACHVWPFGFFCGRACGGLSLKVSRASESRVYSGKYSGCVYAMALRMKWNDIGNSSRHVKAGCSFHVSDYHCNTHFEP